MRPWKGCSSRDSHHTPWHRWDAAAMGTAGGAGPPCRGLSALMWTSSGGRWGHQRPGRDGRGPGLKSLQRSRTHPPSAQGVFPTPFRRTIICHLKMYIPQEKADSKPPARSPPVRVSSVAQISCSYGQRCPTQLPFSLWGKQDNGTPALWLRGCVSRPLHLPSDRPQVSCVSLGCVCVCVCMHTQSCPTVYDPMDYSPPDPLFMGLLRQEYWSGLPFPSPGNPPHPHLLCLLHWRACSLPLSHLGTCLSWTVRPVRDSGKKASQLQAKKPRCPSS